MGSWVKCRLADVEVMTDAIPKGSCVYRQKLNSCHIDGRACDN